MTPPEISIVATNESWVRVAKTKMGRIFTIIIGPNFRPEFYLLNWGQILGPNLNNKMWAELLNRPIFYSINLGLPKIKEKQIDPYFIE